MLHRQVPHLCHDDGGCATYASFSSPFDVLCVVADMVPLPLAGNTILMGVSLACQEGLVVNLASLAVKLFEINF